LGSSLHAVSLSKNCNVCVLTTSYQISAEKSSSWVILPSTLNVISGLFYRPHYTSTLKYRASKILCSTLYTNNGHSVHLYMQAIYIQFNLTYDIFTNRTRFTFTKRSQ